MAEHAKAEWYGNEHRLSDGSYIDKGGNFCYIKNGMFHREDGPAIVQLNGTTIWCLDGKKHREGGGGPAVESVSGYKAWYKDGKLHRNDGPAVIDSDGTEEWWVDGVKTAKDETTNNKTIKNKTIKNKTISNNVKHVKVKWYNNEHNLPDGSYIDCDGDVGYVKRGKLHRECGPAIEFADGSKMWYKNGKRHRDDGPAEEHANGDRWWWVDGKRHRSDGPAVEWGTGLCIWYIDGKKYDYVKDYEEAIKIWKMDKTISNNVKHTKHKKHKKAEWHYNEHNLQDGSYVDSRGSVCYIKDGELHREDGPAIEWSSGRKVWYKNNKVHREDGPAVEWGDCGEEWWINDKRYKTKEEYKEALKIWKMNGVMK